MRCRPLGAGGNRNAACPAENGKQVRLSRYKDACPWHRTHHSVCRQLLTHEDTVSTGALFILQVLGYTMEHVVSESRQPPPAPTWQTKGVRKTRTNHDASGCDGPGGILETTWFLSRWPNKVACAHEASQGRSSPRVSPPSESGYLQRCMRTRPSIHQPPTMSAGHSRGAGRSSRIIRRQMHACRRR